MKCVVAHSQGLRNSDCAVNYAIPDESAATLHYECNSQLSHAMGD